MLREFLKKGRLRATLGLLERRSNGLRVFKNMLRAAPDIVSQRGAHGETLLHYAACYRRGFVAALLKAGADVNARDDDGGRTPLFLTFDNHNHGASVVACLLEHGADLDAKDGNGATPLHAAAWKSNAGVCKSLIAAGARINISDDSIRTPLEFAFKGSARGHLTCAAMLLDAGAYVNNDTFRAAMTYGSPRSVQLLLSTKPRHRLRHIYNWGLPYYFSVGRRVNRAYIRRIVRAGSYEAYEASQRRGLTNTVRRHVVGGRLPDEMVDIIVDFWGHPGGFPSTEAAALAEADAATAEAWFCARKASKLRVEMERLETRLQTAEAEAAAAEARQAAANARLAGSAPARRWLPPTAGDSSSDDDTEEDNLAAV